MVKDSGNHHKVHIDFVENAVALVNNATDAVTVIGSRFAQHWKIFELLENLGNRALVGFRRIATESFRAERINFDQIEPRVPGKPNFNHAARGVRR